MKRSAKRDYILAGIALLLIIIIIVGYFTFFRKQTDYGVCIGASPEDLSQLFAYDTVVIDAQEFSQADIEQLKRAGTTVYSYLNVGSLENSRIYASAYQDLALDTYENWEDEVWINVADERWQEFITTDLGPSLLLKGADGYFIDNLDVYYQYETDEIYEGLVNILEGLSLETGHIIVNGGDTFLTRYRAEHGSIRGITSGVNQECVLTSIDFDAGTFATADEDSQAYFTSHLADCKADGCDVYLLEYTKNPLTAARVRLFARSNDYHYFISKSIDLD